MISSSQWQTFKKDGYLIFPSLIDRDSIAAAKTAIDVYVDSSSGCCELDPHGTIPLYHHQAIWNIRQHPKVYQAFSEAYSDYKLVAGISRCSYKAPQNIPCSILPSWPFHWDCDPTNYQGFSLQGVIYLTDVKADGGPFACIPSIYRNLNGWLARHETSLPSRAGRMIPNSQVPFADVHALPAPSGTLIVFNRLLPHAGLTNVSNVPRVAIFITMEIERSKDDYERINKYWRQREAPRWAQERWEVGDSSKLSSPADLTDLGKKLVGEMPWGLDDC